MECELKPQGVAVALRLMQFFDSQLNIYAIVSGQMIIIPIGPISEGRHRDRCYGCGGGHFLENKGCSEHLKILKQKPAVTSTGPNRLTATNLYLVCLHLHCKLRVTFEIIVNQKALPSVCVGSLLL